MYNSQRENYKRRQRIKHHKCPRCGTLLDRDYKYKLCDKCRSKLREYKKKQG